MTLDGNARDLLARANVLVEEGRTQEAVTILWEASQAFARQGDERHRAGLCRVIGELCAMEKDFAGAARAYRACCDYLRSEGKKPALSRMANDLGLCLARSGSHEEALQAFSESLSLSGELCDDANACAQLGNLGSVHRDRGEYEKALHAYRAALELAERRGFRSLIADQFANIAYVLGRIGKVDEAVKLFDQAARLFRGEGLEEKATAAEENAAGLRAAAGRVS